MTIKEIKENEKPTIIKFFGTWCGPCKTYKPIFDAVTIDFNDQINIVEVNIDDKIDFASSVGVKSIPTTMIVADDEVQEQVVGMKTKTELHELIEKYV